MGLHLYKVSVQSLLFRTLVEYCFIFSVLADGGISLLDRLNVPTIVVFLTFSFSANLQEVKKLSAVTFLPLSRSNVVQHNLKVAVNLVDVHLYQDMEIHSITTLNQHLLKAKI